MNRPNSFTSSSSAGPRKRIRDGVRACAWMMLFLVGMDAAVNLLFPYPDDPKAIPSSLERYFEYGRSVEGKLPRIVGPTDETTQPVAAAGWLNPDDWAAQPKIATQEDGVLLAVYGMSFAADLGEWLCAHDDRLTMRFIGGPAAPPNFVYAAYTMDRGHHDADVAVFAIMASSLRGMMTLTGMTVNFEQPFPFTYPRYTVTDGVLKAEWPRILSLPELRDAMAQPAEWDLFVDQLAEHDVYYSPLLFEGTLLDHSSIARMLRRAWAQRRNLQIIHSIHGPQGFDTSQPLVPALKRMVEKFAETCSADNILPIVYLVNDRGYGDHLFELLQPLLEEKNIPYFSTHVFADPNNPASFIGDGHFTESANDRIGEAFHTMLTEKLSLYSE